MENEAEQINSAKLEQSQSSDLLKTSIKSDEIDNGNDLNGEEDPKTPMNGENEPNNGNDNNNGPLSVVTSDTDTTSVTSESKRNGNISESVIAMTPTSPRSITTTSMSTNGKSKTILTVICDKR